MVLDGMILRVFRTSYGKSYFVGLPKMSSFVEELNFGLSIRHFSTIVQKEKVCYGSSILPVLKD